MLFSRHTRRREFITLLGGAAAAWRVAVWAQQGERMRRIGVLLPAAPDDAEFQSWVGAAILATGNSTVRPLLRLTRTVPIVFPLAADPVAADGWSVSG
jgi:hypothetical protein